ncbi:hypothetical protein [Terriglobus sp.]|uniref:hypothetical protein n=1 Tax=Terriglobus sp. TaxID=1889013 RepID=UPI003B0087F6
MDRGTRGPLVFAAALVLVTALWLLFTGSFKPHESIAGAASVAGTMVFLTIVYRHELQGIDLRWNDALALWRAPWYVITGISEITLALLKDLAGQRAESIFRVCGFHTAKADPHLVTRRALATAYTSVAPNFIVIGIDYRQSRMLFHQIQRSAVPRMTKNLGAEVGSREGAAGDSAARSEAPEQAR